MPYYANKPLHFDPNTPTPPLRYKTKMQLPPVIAAAIHAGDTVIASSARAAAPPPRAPRRAPRRATPPTGPASLAIRRHPGLGQLVAPPMAETAPLRHRDPPPTHNPAGTRALGAVDQAQHRGPAPHPRGRRRGARAASLRAALCLRRAQLPPRRPSGQSGCRKLSRVGARL